ncbi:MAG: hypothetical protein K5925_00870 [Bacilli bacterium]|nr:hypothetical protein [Bacilli bacterium]
MDRNKKILLIGGIIEGAILIFALVLSIIVWTTAVNAADYPGITQDVLAQKNIDKNGAFIAYFQNNPNQLFIIVCVPVFVLIAVDFVYFAIVASKKETNLSSEQMEAIKKKAEEEVRAEMMKELEEEMKEESKPE